MTISKEAFIDYLLMKKLYNRVFTWSCQRTYQCFMRHLKDAKHVQENYLLQLLKNNAASEFGKRHQFDRIKDISSFQAYVPLATYDDYQPLIERQMATAQPILTSAPVKLYELSSGSSAPSKYIPYTSQLKTDYMQAVKPWLFDVYRHFSKLKTGTAYWSISPINQQQRRTKTGVPIGFEDDAGYFDALQGKLLNQLFSVPTHIKKINHVDNFRYVTLLFLLADASLSYISIWNPTFLSLILDSFKNWQPHLIKDIKNGTITPPQQSSIPAELIKVWRAKPKRAAYIESVSKHYAASSTDFSAIWPNLQLISCWNQAQAKRDASQLKHYFSKANFQGKGLLATEGIVSFPLVGIGNIVSYRSHFYEFIEYDLLNDREIGKPKCLWQLQQDHYYQVIMTTGGGLYRYRLGDIVKVNGFHQTVPLVEFIGKGNLVSDLYGEKLNAGHVNALIEKFDFDFRHAFVAPLKNNQKRGYCLFIDSDVKINWAQLAAQFEDSLKDNFHYRYARSLGQLAPLKVFLMAPQQKATYYQHIAKSKNIKLGDIKNSTLWTIDDFDTVLEGKIIDER